MIRVSDVIQCRLRAMRRGAAIGTALLAIVCGSLCVLAQESEKDKAVSPPTVTFTFDFPQSNPEHYSIAVDAAGHARFECNGKIAADPEDDIYRFEFHVLSGTRQRIFDWAKEANYFAGKIDSGNRKLAFTGAKILSYEDGPRSSTGRYNFSNLTAVRQLTELFQNMAATLEFGRRLAYFHRYQKLALDEELKRMEEQARGGSLGEIQAVAPVLQEIADDTSVINGVRARARELIQKGSGPAAGR
jgi:hypothetical protein